MTHGCGCNLQKEPSVVVADNNKVTQPAVVVEATRKQAGCSKKPHFEKGIHLIHRIGDIKDKCNCLKFDDHLKQRAIIVSSKGRSIVTRDQTIHKHDVSY